MLPWNYGFAWNAGHVIFLGAFYAVLLIVVMTIANALRRSHRDLRGQKAEAIRWHSDFEELLSRDRVCRHVLSGELRQRECPNAFDCRHCETHGRLIAKRVGRTISLPAGSEEICGMEFPLDRYYHRGHTWARPETDGTVTVGLDELGKRLLGLPDALDLPGLGTRVLANGTAFRVKRRDAEVRLLSPVDGEVVAVGDSGSEWYLKLAPDAVNEGAFRHLLRGREVAPWIMREMERLQVALAAEGASATLADGGVPVADIAANCPDIDWSAVCGEMFLEP